MSESLLVERMDANFKDSELFSGAKFAAPL